MSFLSESKLLHYLVEIAPYVGHVHMAGCDYGIHRHLPLGMGNVDIAKSMEVLQHAGYKGIFTIETIHHKFSDECYIAAAKNFIAKFGLTTFSIKEE
jgi:sugar phosphate isomerase/epimerase